MIVFMYDNADIADADELICRIVVYRFVAVSVVDMEFLAIDFNPCPRSDGNDPPNYFYNVSRCKPSTTVSSLHALLNILYCLWHSHYL